VSTVPRDAEFMIKTHGINAAGTAMSWALDCSLEHDEIGETYWLSVAMLVMEIQRQQAWPLYFTP
jgi:hypothetical protein